MNLISDVSRQIISLMKILPRPLDFLVFRVYAKVLRSCSSGPYYAKSYFGSVLACDLSICLVQRAIFYFGIWEPMVSCVTEKLLREGDVFVDVGANIGYDTLLASHCVGGAGNVVSIEASPRIYSLLAGNVARNRASNIRLVNVAASDSRKTLAIYYGDKFALGQSTTIEARGQHKECNVEALPLDEILSVSELSRVRLVKIDIEGAELPVMTRLLDTLSLYPESFSIIVEASVHEDPREWGRVFARLRGAGFLAYEIENRYDIEWYFRYSNHSSVKLIKTLPNRQLDILFTRMVLPATLEVDMSDSN